MVNVSWEVVAIVVVAALGILSGVLTYLYNRVRELENMIHQVVVYLFGPDHVDNGGLKEDISEFEEEHEGLRDEIERMQESMDRVLELAEEEEDSDDD